MVFRFFMLYVSAYCSYAQERECVIVVHGGVSAMNALKDQPQKEMQYYASLDTAFMIGDKIFAP
ncbi:MAG: hypothetical protein PHG27_00235 [Massilibacteroides sp.]|nr:hypothetical protein [Massilibacteroides sp.]MDD3062246.1 hypothetical protein [Massilibacteroides sp.]MDD4114015.1 hypothetical protein [Massilibacteroides sp.]MDD4660019.1 hypothetical protein [Massilibacteroides sp.]